MKANRNIRRVFIYYLLMFVTPLIGLRAQESASSGSSTLNIPVIDPESLGLQFQNLGEVELQGQPCWRVKLEGPNEDDPDSLRIEMLVRQADNRPLQVNYYDNYGEVIKTLYLEEVQRIAGAPTTMQLRLKNHISGDETSINLLINYELKSLEQ